MICLKLKNSNDGVRIKLYLFLLLLVFSVPQLASAFSITMPNGSVITGVERNFTFAKSIWTNTREHNTSFTANTSYLLIDDIYRSGTLYVGSPTASNATITLYELVGTSTAYTYTTRRVKTFTGASIIGFFYMAGAKEYLVETSFPGDAFPHITFDFFPDGNGTTCNNLAPAASGLTCDESWLPAHYRKEVEPWIRGQINKISSEISGVKGEKEKADFVYFMVDSALDAMNASTNPAALIGKKTGQIARAGLTAAGHANIGFAVDQAVQHGIVIGQLFASGSNPLDPNFINAWSGAVQQLNADAVSIMNNAAGIMTLNRLSEDFAATKIAWDMLETFISANYGNWDALVRNAGLDPATNPSNQQIIDGFATRNGYVNTLLNTQYDPVKVEALFFDGAMNFGDWVAIRKTLANPFDDVDGDGVLNLQDPDPNDPAIPAAPATPTNGLVAHYTFDGNAQDSSGNGNHGSVTGAPTYVAGVSGQAMNFTGTDLVTASDPFPAGASLSSPMTVSTWIKTTTTKTSAALVTQWSACTVNQGDNHYLNIYNSAGNRTLTAGYGGTVRGVDRTLVTDGQWHHIVSAWDGSAVNIYIDGQQVTSQAFANGFTYRTGTPLAIGGFFDDRCSFNSNYEGSIDDVRIYNRALSAAEISQLAGVNQNLANGLVAHYAFDGNAQDSSGYGNHATIVGASFVAGTSDQAIYFNNPQGAGRITQYVALPNSNSITSLNQSSLTFNIRLKTTDSTKQNGRLFGANWDVDGFFMDYNGGSPQAYSGIRSGGLFIAVAHTQATASNPEAIVTDGLMHNLTLVVDRANALLIQYVDGQLIDSASIAGIGSIPLSDIVLGAAKLGDNYGARLTTVDDLRIYSRALTAAEVAQLAGGNLNNGLIAHYTFDGNAQDSSGNGNHGTDNGAVTYVAGHMGRSANFVNGPSNNLFFVDQYAQMPNVTLTNFTVSHWVKFISNGAPAPHAATSYSFGSVADTDFGFFFSFDHAGNAMASLKYGAGGAWSQAVNVNDGVWHHLAATYDGSNVNFYADGSHISTMIIPAAFSVTSAPQFVALNEWNANRSRSSRFNGGVDELRIYNRALSVAEVAQLAGGSPQGGGVPANPSTVSVSLNATSFTSGDTLTMTGTTVASTPVTTADIYYGLQLPDNTLLVMQPGGSFSTALTPFQANTAVPDATTALFNYTLTGLEPTGSYTWLAALMEPGTFNVIGQMASAPFTITAPPPAAVTLTGNWAGRWSSASPLGRSGALNIGLTQLGLALSGSGSAAGTAIGTAQGTVSGTKSGNNVSMGFALSNGQSIQYTGTVNAAGTSMSGNYSFAATSDSGTWTVTKQ